MILESNLINLLILIFILVRFARQVVGEILWQRQQQVMQALADAQQRLAQAEQQFKSAEQDWLQTQNQIQQIEQEASQTAEAVRQYWLQQANEAIAQLKVQTNQSLHNASKQVAKQIKQTFIELAINKVKQTPVDGEVILDRHISSLTQQYYEAKNR
uniref:ATP synthase subunit b, chloroplastic n=1 Tax=Cyanidiococcus yangmingshanensis TaxID=2690220 RepID=A0A7G5VUR6_9RHOD|nr:ATP synthase CF0 B subunit subunit I [Cyanidiococcus yangmingshanensis]QMX77433.1 ATP synthase CF0 B subunit subunit I [Cyanidiococcus yangmingshanensis]UNJ16047.1 ATP synthase CFO B subunit subunit I [Cyanidioschyzonaceae sp. 3]WDB00460.1 ATP synthase CF0 B chain [Cyanidiococcus yangmingshanensis]